VPTANLAELSLVAGRAVAHALAELAGVLAEVKWPNDVLVNGRKVAGILAEARDGRVVLGIGINVSQSADDLPSRPTHPATSLLIETGKAIPRADLLAAVLSRLEREYDAWVAGYR
jgi:BirA family biotin operon repressor/biotin-[acetyl-CoA-carboxylase] ligase